MSSSTAPTQIMVEKRRPGFFGKCCSYTFWGWQALMLVWLVTSIVQMGSVENDASSHAEQWSRNWRSDWRIPHPGILAGRNCHSRSNEILHSRREDYRDTDRVAAEPETS